MNNTSSTNANMTNTSLDIPAYLTIHLGDRYVSTVQLIVLNVIYIGIFLSGTIGNICTCIVIARNRNMHTATNYYLVSLAVADLLTLGIAWPPELYSIWEAYPFRFGGEFCILKSYIQEGTAYASVLTITAFTVERYVAICHPLRFQGFSNLSRSIKVIIAVWLASFSFALPYALYGKQFYYVLDPNTNEPLEDSLVCSIPLEYLEMMKIIFQVSTFAFFCLPMTIILVMYILIGITLYNSDMIGDNKSFSRSSKTSAASNSLGQRNSNHVYDPTKARKSVLKMLVAVVIAFFLCWAPFHSQRLMTLYITDWTPELHTIQTTLFYISGVLYFVSSTVNPILYNLMSKKFRQASKKTLCKCCFKKEFSSKASLFGNGTYRDRPSQYSYSRISRNGMIQSRSTTLHETSVADISVHRHHV
ncbi:pyrokinin-1 receptor-like isoform X1 [Mytilus galloprovincialis]|uniref:pyrokinin-1 receptor-like isoform X1 n=1 Tax=Mytilus galloprovincialis TaxID=29158 RepID=UPI003F7B6945